VVVAARRAGAARAATIAAMTVRLSKALNGRATALRERGDSMRAKVGVGGGEASAEWEEKSLLPRAGLRGSDSEE
jgi:hypothetical protein